MYCNLPKVEIWIYFIVWTSGILYSIYNVYLAGDSLDHSSRRMFDTGWSFIGRKKDVADLEWGSWGPMIWASVPWVCLHLVVAEITRYASKELLPLWYLSLSMLYLLLNLGTLPTAFLLLEPCLMYLLLQLRSRAVIYVAGVALLVFHNIDLRMHWAGVPYQVQYVMAISSAWIYMRSQSFCLDRLSGPKVGPGVTDLVTMLGYCFYFPVLFLGPVILFQQFETGVLRPYTPWTTQRIRTLVLNILRFTWWILFLEMFLHFVYVNALQSNVRHVKNLSTWAHYGLGYSMGAVFQLKYVITYGLSCSIARAEQIDAPQHPKCIARIHLYSDMWRHFDHGLYLFLRKYIYFPVVGDIKASLARRLLASFACFAFVYAWHNVYVFVLIWSVLNYIGITLEAVCKVVGSNAKYQKCETLILSTQQNIRRFHALIATPLFMMSALSNFYFFAGTVIGNHFVRRLFEGTVQQNCTLFLFCYCCSQVSIEIKNWEQSRLKKQI